ncbi:MAG: rhomboid family intramembrane serine protease [Angustibacter sp.]
MSDEVPPGQTGPVAAPVCPRHPDQVSYVRCQRCERPTCPQCQRSAAVGVQCVDCVRDQARTMRPVRTAFGGRASEDDVPRATYAIIGACAAMFLLQLANSRITFDLAFVPALAETEPWRFLTSAFLHSRGFFLHIAFNVLVLYQIGPYLERTLGRLRYVAVYLVCAFGGSVGYLVLADPWGESWRTAVVGASGAVFGLFGALLVVQRRLGQDNRGLFVLVGLNVVIGFVVSGIAWQSHLGGLVTGAGCAAALVLPRGPRRTVLQAGGLAAVVAVLVLVSALKLLLV